MHEVLVHNCACSTMKSTNLSFRTTCRPLRESALMSLLAQAWGSRAALRRRCLHASSALFVGEEGWRGKMHGKVCVACVQVPLSVLVHSLRHALLRVQVQHHSPRDALP